MWVELGNLNCRVTRASDEERSWLCGYLSFDDAKARYRRGGPQDIKMYSPVAGTFPAGFLPLVRKAAEAAGHKVEVADLRARPCSRDALADLSWLRDYQREAVEAAISKERGILWHPTGAGKTHSAVALAVALPCRWLFVVHRSTLVLQAAERFESLTGLPAGRVGEGTWVVERFTCATFQTLHARMGEPAGHDLLTGAQGLIIDECHTSPAESFMKVIRQTPNAFYRIGLSGTPLARGDRRSVLAIAAIGPVIHRIKPELLIEAGVLARPKIRMVPVLQSSDKPTWQGVYGECVVRSARRNRALVEMARRAAKPCLVFVKEISHGKLLEAAIRKAGMKTEFVWGQDSSHERQAAIRRLERGDSEVLVTSVVMQEGVDVPSLRSVVVGSGGSSVIAALQRIGRGMRTDGGTKHTFEVHDVEDRGCRWLDKHSRARRRAYLGEGHEVVIDENFGQQIALAKNAREAQG